MRTIDEIKKEMTDAILNDSNLRSAFGLNQNEEWDNQVSSVSILNLIIYVVAVAARTIEWLHERFRAEVEERIAAAFPGSVSWYWNKVMQFRYGYELDENLNYSQEALDDDEALIIKHCAILEVDNGIVVKVNKADYGTLNADELAALVAYLAAVKFAGTMVNVYSNQPDKVRLKIYIWRDPLVLGADLHALDGTDVIKAAVNDYLDGIVYGGVLNKTKLIDAIQAVSGVLDVTLSSTCQVYCPADNTTYDLPQNFTSRGGHFQLDTEHFQLVERNS